MEYHFKLNDQLSAEDDDPDDIIEHLGATGCDDVLALKNELEQLTAEAEAEGLIGRLATADPNG